MDDAEEEEEGGRGMEGGNTSASPAPSRSWGEVVVLAQSSFPSDETTLEDEETSRERERTGRAVLKPTEKEGD